ncbi:MAG: MATE family efflux transporter [Methanobrevibacter sp.]
MDNAENVNEILESPKKSIRKFSVTVMFAMVFMFAYNIVDTIFVGGLGIDALTAVGFFTPLYMVIVAIGQGIGTGVGTSISRYIGEKNIKEANNAAWHSIFIVIVLSFIFVLLNFFGLKEILIFLGAKSVINQAVTYGGIQFVFSIIFLLDFISSSILRAEGDMKRSLIMMAVGCILNGFGDYVFIYLFNYGIIGAAISSILASAISASVMFYWILVKKDTYLKMKISDFKYKFSLVKEILNVGVPATLEGVVMDVTQAILNFVLMIVGGSIAVATFTAGWKIVMLAMLPALGVEAAILTVAGMNFGADNLKNIRNIYNYSLKFSVAISLVVGILLFVFSKDVSYFLVNMIPTSELINSISTFIKILVPGIIAIPIGLCSTAMFQAEGNGKISLVLVLLRDLILSSVFAIVLAFPLHMGSIGVYIGLSLGYIISAIISFSSFEAYFKRLVKRDKAENTVV